MTNKSYPIEQQTAVTQPLLNLESYQALYARSLNEPEAFWAEQAKQFISFETPYQKIYQGDMAKGDNQWFVGGKLNISYNCIDRHLNDKAQQTAIIFEGDEPGQSQHISYQQLHDNVCQLANALKQMGVKKGDRVCLYMPMVLEATYAMLACARLGAIHSVVFGGFSPEALASRIQDTDCSVLITADEGVRGGKTVALKANADKALEQCPNVEHCLVVARTNADINMQQGRDVYYHDAIKGQASTCEPTWVDSEDPLFVLYTSGSTGKPKGVVHHSAGYLLHAAMSHYYAFNYQQGDVYWCTADVGWVTGHSYIVYGPLANGATTLVFEGTPTYPDASRCWDIVEQHQVNIFYTAPTAIRALMAAGTDYVEKHNIDSLKILGTVGEPINPEAWQWYYQNIGQSRCPIIDTWWQTETGAIMMCPLANVKPLKPGAASLPFFGIEPVLLDDNGQELSGEASGKLAIKRSWPGIIRTVYNNHQRLVDTYFADFPGYYFTGDGAKRDGDGYYWITGRVDDVINVSGHRLGTAEIESAISQHKSVAETAVVGFPHDIKGEAIYAYVVLKPEVNKETVDKSAIIEQVKQSIGAIAKPEHIQITDDLPKTRSGKIMRRILRKIAANDLDNLGDTSTLVLPEVVDDLIAQRKNHN